VLFRSGSLVGMEKVFVIVHLKWSPGVGKNEISIPGRLHLY